MPSQLEQQHENTLDVFDDDDYDDEEEECRVCRGPAEEGRPLFKPCKCSGSIGLTHQDCLTSWLDINRGDGRCELCSTRFQFAPRYADGAPSRLPVGEVCYLILRRALAKWLPFGLRALFAACLWLVVLPLSTAYIYQGWMHRPSSIPKRWNWELAKRDTMGGAVIAIIVIVSFLSLMSFADFLRFHWHRQQEARVVRQGLMGGANIEGVEDMNRPRDDEVVDVIVQTPSRDDADLPTGEDVRSQPRQPESTLFGHETEEDNVGAMDEVPFFEEHFDIARTLDESVDESTLSNDHSLGDCARDRTQNGEYHTNGFEKIDNNLSSNLNLLDDTDGGLPNDADVANYPPATITSSNSSDVNNISEAEERTPLPQFGDDERLEELVLAQEEEELALQRQIHDELPGQEGIPPPQEEIEPNPRRRDDARFEPQFEPLQPAFEQDDQDDVVDMEINVALDELLGFRGPVLALIRNLLWLLIFNTAYIGIFAFLPSSFGDSMSTVLSKAGFLRASSKKIPGMEKICNFVLPKLYLLDETSKSLNSLFQPSEIAKVCLGYLTISCSIFLLHMLTSVVKRGHPFNALPAEHENEREQGRANLVAERNNNRNAFVRRNVVEEVDDGAGLINPHDDNADVGETVRKRLFVILECAAAIVKVVTLLFLKMFLLPLLLGFWLDVATLSLFEKTLDDRILYVGRDLFGSILLHWVTGITFMLLVTVSVLQLREVAHPDILAKVIRPQEPQPDLLGNLLQESGTTHAKRILLSLGIYAALLTIHVWLPSHFLVILGIGRYLPFFQPKFWHFLMPQVQIPVELLLFHLCMLGFLEKYKNKIGEMQHHWLVFMERILGLTDRILPRQVDKFILLGTLPVFTEDLSANHVTSLTQHAADGSKATRKSSSPLINEFWSELLAAKGQLEREVIIDSNIEKLVKPVTLCYENGITRRDGKQVVSTPKYIRFPSSSDKTLGAESPSEVEPRLLPTCVGPYHLKQRVLRKLIMTSPCRSLIPKRRVAFVTIIEVWREVSGDPIPRPPEGWDDLGVGGAESQGRWAWGEERLSKIEAGVAARTAFLDRSACKMRTRICNVVQLGAKMALLLFISWLAITAVLCVVMNVPLSIGRCCLVLLRVPGRYMHDPLAFAIGSSLLVPSAEIASQFILSRNEDDTDSRLSMRSCFRLLKHNHSTEKMKVLLSFSALWLFYCPLLLGSLYGSFFVGLNIHRFRLNWRVIVMTLFLNWGTGVLLLNSWAIMCYFSFFKKEFWLGVAAGDEAANQNEDAGPGFDNHVDEGEQNVGVNFNERPGNFVRSNQRWQGEHGIISNCVHSLAAVALRSEWDKVDRYTLLEECALPLTWHLLTSYAFPLGIVLFPCLIIVGPMSTNDLAGIFSPWMGIIAQEPYLTSLFRLFTICIIALKLIISFRRPLSRWFQAAHKIARDDRYLIGEILLNYSPSQT